MKKIFYIPVLLLFLIVVGQLIYFKYFTFSVIPSNEAIITESNKVVGQAMKPGLHRFNPFTQEVHSFNVKRLNEWNEKIQKQKTYKFRVWWHIKNPIVYYETSQETNLKNEIIKILQAVKTHIESEYDEELINQMSSIECCEDKSNNSTLIALTNFIQQKVDKFGIRIAQVDFKI